MRAIAKQFATDAECGQGNPGSNLPAKPDLTLLFALARVYRDLQLNAKKRRAR